MAIDMGRLKNKKTTILPIIWERDASRGILKGFTIVSWKIQHFVNLNSKLIELKKSVSRWTRSCTKISPIEWRKKSTFDTETIGWSLSINLEKSDRWKIALTSTMCWQQQTVQKSGEQQLRPVPFWKYQQRHPSSSSSSSSWWQWSDSWWSSWQLRKSTTELMCRTTW